MDVDLLIVGGGTGGCAAAMAAADLGLSVLMTEESDWIGGQLTAQAVPPDEHPWIEQFGCTRRYRAYRDGVRAAYRPRLRPETARDPWFNPGGGWVSRLCHEPKVGLAVIESMVPASVTVWRNCFPVGADAQGDRVREVALYDAPADQVRTVRPRFVLDATESGELLPLAGVEYRLGAESKAQTGEPNALDGPPEPDNVQGLTWVYAVALDEGSHRVIDRPARYGFWRLWKPDFWPGPLLGFEVLHAHTGEPRTLPLFSENWYALFPYRQIVDPARVVDAEHPVTIVNWPQNDYFLETILDVDAGPTPAPRVPFAAGPRAEERLLDGKELGLCLLYWLQTEAPRHDGGTGYPGLYLRPDIVGTDDGFAKVPYLRESRRIEAMHTVCEQDVAAYTNPNCDRAPEVPDSVGVGAYRIDLHPSTSGANTIDTSSLPFQIPLRSLVPVRMRNLLPACKNLGVTHITNGCYRLHPVEWNIGEVSGALAAFCLQRGVDPQSVASQPALVEEFQTVLTGMGVEIAWPRLRAL